MINKPIIIREATLEDIPFLRAMIWEALLASPRFLEEHGVENIKQREDESWKRWQEHPTPAFVAVDASDQKLGAIRLRPGNRDSPVSDWYIGISVETQARGQGIGRQLMERTIEWAKTSGAKSLTLLVDPTNSPAIALYRRVGFIELGVEGSVIKMRIEF